MVLKTKLSMGLGFLFLIIFALAFVCSYYVEKLSDEADRILKNNYDSIVVATAHREYKGSEIASLGIPVVDSRRLIEPGANIYQA